MLLLSDCCQKGKGDDPDIAAYHHLLERVERALSTG